MIAAFATMNLATGPAQAAPGQWVSMTVAFAAETAGTYQLSADIVNPANGATEGHFFAQMGGAGGQSISGETAAGAHISVTMYSGAMAAASDIAAYDPSRGLSIVITLNGVQSTVPGAIFLPDLSVQGSGAMLNITDVGWYRITPMGYYGGAQLGMTVYMTNPQPYPVDYELAVQVAFGSQVVASDTVYVGVGSGVPGSPGTQTQSVPIRGPGPYENFPPQYEGQVGTLTVRLVATGQSFSQNLPPMP